MLEAKICYCQCWSYTCTHEYTQTSARAPTVRNRIDSFIALLLASMELSIYIGNSFQLHFSWWGKAANEHLNFEETNPCHHMRFLSLSSELAIHIIRFASKLHEHCKMEIKRKYKKRREKIGADEKIQQHQQKIAVFTTTKRDRWQIVRTQAAKAQKTQQRRTYLCVNCTWKSRIVPNVARSRHKAANL